MSLVLLMVPGRKGKMRTEREVTHGGVSSDDARTLYAGRLAYDGFQIEPSSDPLYVKAVRRRAPNGETLTHSDKTMCVEVRLTPDARPDGGGCGGGGVRVRVAAWLDDFVLFDTGEGRLVDLTLDRLMTAELDREPPPVVPNQSLLASSSLVTALLGMTTIAMLTLRPSAPTTSTTAAIVGGATLACFGAIMLAREALKQIRACPSELLGSGTARATFFLAPLGLAAGVVAMCVRYRETLGEFFQP
jgi:hypothetical protein